MRRWGGAAAWAALGCAGVIDVAVIAHTGDSITASCRRHPAVTATVLAAFVLHLFSPAWFRRWDPFALIGAAAGRVGRA